MGALMLTQFIVFPLTLRPRIGVGRLRYQWRRGAAFHERIRSNEESLDIKERLAS